MISTRARPAPDASHAATCGRTTGTVRRTTVSLTMRTALALLAAACGRADRASDGPTHALASRATGIWEAEFRLARTPLGPAAVPAPVVRGTLALLEGRAGIGREWLDVPGTHTGVYDVDFRPFGFVPEPAGPVPTLVVAAVAPDTLLGATPAGAGGGTLAFRGTLSDDADSGRGSWTYGSRAVGGWGGTFSLRARPSRP